MMPAFSTEQWVDIMEKNNNKLGKYDQALSFSLRKLGNITGVEVMLVGSLGLLGLKN